MYTYIYIYNVTFFHMMKVFETDHLMDLYMIVYDPLASNNKPVDVETNKLIYPKHWNSLTPYHNFPKIPTSPFYYYWCV